MRSWRRKKQKQNSSRSGAEAERSVRRFYRLRGYRILGANVRAGGNELDIILRRGSRLVVCEVKARSGPGYGDPWEAVGPEKQRRLRRAAESWLVRNPELQELEVACEVVAVRGRRIERASLG
jgi:putative endonuclease